MKAVRFDNYGGIDVLRVADVPVPEPVQGQVLVRVKAAAINPGETKIRVWPIATASSSAARRWAAARGLWKRCAPAPATPPGLQS